MFKQLENVMFLRHFFVVLQADQYKHCMHSSIFLYRISIMDTEMYNTNYVMFAGPSIFAVYIRYLLIMTLCFKHIVCVLTLSIYHL